MVNYNVIAYETDRKNSVESALVDLHAQLETVDNSKTIRFLKVIKVGTKAEGLAIYDA